MTKQFHIGLPVATAEAAEEFTKSLDRQIDELEQQLKLLRGVRAAVKATFPLESTWLGAAVADVAHG